MSLFIREQFHLICIILSIFILYLFLGIMESIIDVPILVENLVVEEL